MPDALITLIIATTALLGSPGPATLALAATGASFGARQGLRFLGGILTGLAIVITLTASGLSALLMSGSLAARGLLVFSVLYITYLAWKVATAPILTDPGTADTTRAPGFRDGLILNLTNPKAYAAFAALFAAFSLPIENVTLRLWVMGGFCFLAGLVIDILWLLIGKALAGAFANPDLARPLRMFFAAAMLLAVFWSLTKLTA